MTKEFSDEISRWKVLSEEDETEMFMRLAETGDIELKQELILRNMRIAIKESHRYKNTGFDLEELEGVANVALCHAVDAFDPHKGFKFVTYASTVINRSLLNYMQSCTSKFKIPRGVVSQVYIYQTFVEQYEERFGGVPSDEEIQEACDLTPTMLRAIREYLCNNSHFVYIDSLCNKEDGDSPLSDLIGCTQEEPDAGVIREELSETMRKCLRELPDKDRSVIIMRFGLDGGSPKTLEEVGAKLSVTRERVRQLEKRSLLRLRSMSEVREFA